MKRALIILVAVSGVAAVCGCQSSPPEGAVASTHAAVSATPPPGSSSRGAYFQTSVTGNYLSADNGGGGTLNAAAPWARGWEHFTLFDANGGDLADGDLVYVVSENGYVLSADGGGGGALTATAPWMRGWEAFNIVRLAGPGAVSTGDSVALRTEIGQTYVSADNGGGGSVNAAAPWSRSWETFVIALDPAAGPPASGGALDQVLGQAMFESMFPNRDPFYTYDGLVQATATYPAFASTGSLDDRKREVAAFLANVNRETGALVYIEEIDKADYIDGSSGCSAEPGKQYYGRGPLQLSWTTNYCAASAAIFGDSNVLRADPDRVARDAQVAWATGLWYWMSTCHDPLMNGNGFGSTVNAINGPVECNGGNPSAVDDRVQAYLRFCSMLGVDPGGNLYC